MAQLRTLTDQKSLVTLSHTAAPKKCARWPIIPYVHRKESPGAEGVSESKHPLCSVPGPCFVVQTHLTALLLPQAYSTAVHRGLCLQDFLPSGKLPRT